MYLPVYTYIYIYIDNIIIYIHIYKFHLLAAIRDLLRSTVHHWPRGFGHPFATRWDHICAMFEFVGVSWDTLQ